MIHHPMQCKHVDHWRDTFSLIDIYRGAMSVPRGGDAILLWKDVWLPDEVLQDKYNHMFSFSPDEDISLAPVLGS